MGDEYLPRIADDLLDERLGYAGGVLIRGAKWCGKTRTAEQHAKSALYLQDPDTRVSNLDLAQTKPSVLLRGPKPRLIDEWQDAPQLWDAARFAIDRTHEHGQFIFTGSATPGTKPAHSGTGRFSFFTMYPMALHESRESTNEVSLSDLFDAPSDIEGAARGDIETIAEQVCRGGWPEAVTSGLGAATSIPMDYLAAVSEEDISEVDGVKRNPHDAMLIMRAFARCVGTMSDFKSIRLSITQRKGEMSRTTFGEYVNALRRLYVFDDLEAWRPSLRARTRVSATPTRHFVDPSLAAAALGASPGMLLSDMPTLGLLFESLCVRDLRAYLSAARGELYHYHDMTGLEADAVAIVPDGRWGAFEMKTNPHAVDDGAASLKKLAAKVDASVGKMAFLAVITASGYAYRRDDGVYVIPISCLAP